MAKHELENKARDTLAGVLVVEGVMAALFGIAALFWPGLTAAVFIKLFGVFVLVWGLVSLVHSFLGIGRSNLWWVESIFSLAALGLGIFLLRNPDVSAAVIILTVGFTLVARGVVDFLVGLFATDSEVKVNRWFYILMGLVGVAAGIAVLAHPVASGLVFVWALGFYMLLSGALNIGLAFRVRSIE